jgi:ketopantoate reductase
MDAGIAELRRCWRMSSSLTIRNRSGRSRWYLFAVKLRDTETAGEQTRPLLGHESRVITLQNGVDSVERLVPILGEEVTIAGTTYVVTTIAKPGVIHHTGTTARIHCGRLDRRPDLILTGYVDKMKAANVDITLAENILLAFRAKSSKMSATGH